MTNEIPSPENNEQEIEQQFIDFVQAHTPEQPNDGNGKRAGYDFIGQDQLIPVDSVSFAVGTSTNSPDYDIDTDTGSSQQFEIELKGALTDGYDIKYDDATKEFTTYAEASGDSGQIDPSAVQAVLTTLSNAEQQGLLTPRPTS
ncbi:MAG: hypothetical protein AAB462_00360 [Patescibacteria group bacterium]|mgnify:CR=1 FL=1